MVSALPDHYWVAPGHLMAGEYPGSRRPTDVEPRLGALRGLGIRSLVDLTEEGELEPYSVVANALGLGWRRFPIEDLGVPSNRVMVEILVHIAAEVAAGRPVYVHCWGGIGRTGTVVGCWLRQHGYSADEVVEELASLRTGSLKSARSSPETDEQRAFVASWPVSLLA